MHEPFDPWKMTKICAGLAALASLGTGAAFLWCHAEGIAHNGLGGVLVGLLLGCGVLGGIPAALLLALGSVLDRMRLTSYALRQGAPQRFIHHRW